MNLKNKTHRKQTKKLQESYNEESVVCSFNKETHLSETSSKLRRKMTANYLGYLKSSVKNGKLMKIPNLKAFF